MSRIFISHSSKDGVDKTRELVALLEAAGVPCWVAPRDMKPGLAFSGQIISAIRKSRALVVLLTPAANQSPDVLGEVTNAQKERKLIVPVIVEGTQPCDNLIYFLATPMQQLWTEAQTVAAALVRVFDRVVPAKPTPEDLTKLAPGTVFRDRGAGLDMVRLPAGSFVMGSAPQEKGRDPREGPTHKVTIDYPLAVAKYPVTRGQWRRYLHSTGKKGSANGWAWDRAKGRWQQHSDYSWETPGFFQDDHHPAVCVTWDEAQEYAQWLSEKTGAAYRLLSEAEWEYAARAGTNTAYYWGDEAASSCAHYYGCGSDWDKKGTAPAGSFAPNPWGLFDMLGNVYEWTQDSWNSTYRSAPCDGSARTSEEGHLRVVRGGSCWNDSVYMRAACRCANGRKSTGHHDQGLRVART